MCGIFGYFDRSGGSLSLSELEKMGKVISHRGPDDFGMFTSSHAAVGNCRLSIIDLENGRQPFLSDDGKVAVVQNGEIYNYIELAKDLAQSGYPCRTSSDTEVLLRLYEKEGIDFVSQLNGMFSIAIYDGRKKCLFLIRDRVGVKPLFVYDDGKRLLFASEIKGVLAAGIPREMEPEALHHYLSFNYVPPPFTLFKGVKHLMPGHWLRIDEKGSRSQRWWNLASIQPEKRTEAEWIHDLTKIMDDSVRIRMRSDVPFGAFLSGGTDSGAVVGLMSKHMSEPIRTFSIGFKDPRYDESAYALQVSDRYKTSHFSQKVDSNLLSLWPLVIYHCDQAHGDVSFLPTHRVSEMAARHVKMVLTGDGGDELFAGYEKYADFFSKVPKDSPDLLEKYFASISLMGAGAKAALYTESFGAALKKVDSFSIAQEWFSQVPQMDPINQALYLDTMLLLPGNNLVKPDRMAMAVSLEARDPLLDYRLVELAFRMPGSLKLQGRETKAIYKKAILPLLDHDLVYRKKQMFTVPIGDWFKRELKAFVQEVLLGKRTMERGIFNSQAVQTLFEEHTESRMNRTREIRALIALELWFRVFLDQSELSVPSYKQLGLSDPGKVRTH